MIESIARDVNAANAEGRKIKAGDTLGDFGFRVTSISGAPQTPKQASSPAMRATQRAPIVRSQGGAGTTAVKKLLGE